MNNQMMYGLQDQCSRNPKGGSHCYCSTNTIGTTIGIVTTKTCCWCGHGVTVNVSQPEHGPHAKQYDVGDAQLG